MIEQLSVYADTTSLLVFLKVFLINLNKELSSLEFFRTILELNILCLQCSELIWANIINSISFGDLLSLVYIFFK